ncbi:hypothetical protein [Spirosoma luteum]|uniref:hypothetical protein n=1 Tax=Spirosoma luteum TaxID=431553 RepID=UPI00037C2F9F|nr:hypothetical protein [Spirosoma luteum]
MIKQYSPDTVVAKPIWPKRIFWRIAEKFKLERVVNLFINKDSYLVDQGWFLSIRTGKSVGGQGQPIPWLTYPFINFIEPRLKKSMTMYEFGCGNSTLWFAERVGSVQSVEHDKEWYEAIAPKLPSNVKLTLEEIVSDETYSSITFMAVSDETSYSSVVSHTGQLYDIILVDGVYRANSIAHSVHSLKEGGVIILDNVDYVESQECKNYMEKDGFKRLDFWGMCPIVHHDSCTAIFYKENNCLNI